MEEILEFIEDIKALNESIGISVLAPEYGAGVMEPQLLFRMTTMITGLCDKIIKNIQAIPIVSE